MTNQFSIKNFLSLSSRLLKPLENRGFSRAPEFEEISPTMATLIYLGKHVAFVFSIDIRDQCVDADVVKVQKKKLFPNWEGGYSSNIFTHLVKHEIYRGGPKGANWSPIANDSPLAQEIKGWLNLLETAGERLLQDSVDSLP